MTKVLNWIKANVFIVVFAALMLIAVIAAPIVAGWLNGSVMTDANERASKWVPLTSIEKTQFGINVPGWPAVQDTLTINPSLLDKYRTLMNTLKEDAAEVRAAAVRHNSKGRTVLLESLFPEPPMDQRETLPFEFHRRLLQAYDELLKSVNAGSPPTADQLTDDLLRRELHFITNTLRKKSRAELDPSELEALKEELYKTRIARADEIAQRVGVYASTAVLNVPRMPEGRLPTLGEMFNWQWGYWITEDVLNAIKASRGESDSVLDAPVKRVLSLRILNAVNSQDRPGAAASGGGGPSFGSSASDGSGAEGDPSAQAGAGGAAIDPTAEAARDYTGSFTGRRTNPLYDVRLVELKVVAATSRLPALLDALARQNFITVLDVSLEPADHFAAAQEGYMYGSEPTSQVTLLLETVWLREWTALRMPAELRNALGIALPATPDPAAAPAG